MGTLVIRKYPTKLFLKAADHTYVECGTGAKGWGCWGGKTGGAFLRSAPGSTLRANAVAEPDEKAGITCYLVNGVCHQAANRIVNQSGITVDGARGYSLSVALFGVLGRKRALFGLCRAPFDEHAGIHGDLPECVEDAAGIVKTGDVAVSSNPGRHDFEDPDYMASVRELHDRADEALLEDPEYLFEQQMEHFRLLVEHKFGFRDGLVGQARDQLMEARARFERRRLEAERELAVDRNGTAFARTFDHLTLQFQDDVARALDRKSYSTLLDLSPDERIVLSDPDIERSYGSNAGPEGAAT